MERNRIAVIIVAIVIVVAAAVAIVSLDKGNNDDGNDDQSITITDGIGRTVTIGTTDRITSASTTVTAMLCGIGLSSQIVGVTTDAGVYDEDASIIGMTDDDFPKAIVDGLADGSITGLGNMYNISAESLVKVETDIIVFGEYGYNENTGKQLDSYGVTYIVLKNEDTLETALNNIILLGKVFDKEAEAERMVDEMNNVIDTIDEWCESIVETKLGGVEKNVAVMMTSTYATGPEYIAGSMLDRVHASNVFMEVGMYAPVSKEAIAEKNPEVIIYTTLGMGDGITDINAYVESIRNDPILGGVDASKTNHIYAVSGSAINAMSYVTQGFVTAYAMYAMFIYSEYLDFDLPNVLDSDNYSEYVFQFWNMIN